jgi:hypothetical protein
MKPLKTRFEKITFLKNVSKGKIDLKPQIEEPDFTKLTDSELRHLVELQDKYDMTDIDALEKEITEDDYEFLIEMVLHMKERPSGFGENEFTNESKN